jgi:hypothetical protein
VATSNGRTYQQARKFLTAVLAGGGSPSGGTSEPGLETSLRASGDAVAQEHCQGSDGSSSGGSVVLDVAEWLRVFAGSGKCGSYAGQLGTGHGVK